MERKGIYHPKYVSKACLESTQVLTNDYVTEFGQHIEEVLTEILGYTWDDIAKLKDEETV